VEIKLFDKMLQPLRQNLPEANSIDDYLEYKILPKVRPWSEDLREQKFYIGKSWMELRDDVNFHKTVLHLFNPDGEYLKSEDGEISCGKWRFLAESNKFLIMEDDKDCDGELYDLAFLDDDYFILRKHGNQRKLGKPTFFLMLHEPLAKRTNWREAMEILYDKANRSVGFYILLFVAFLLVIIIWLLL
jgi:hypothetical protein